MNDKTEHQLRDSMQRQADRFEPSDGALAQLEARVAEAGNQRPSAVTPRVMLAAAALVITVGTAVGLAVRQPAQQVEVLSTEVPVVTTQPVTVETTEVVIVADEQTPETNSAGDPVELAVAYPQLAWDASVGPRAETRDQAAIRFLELVRIDFDSITIDGANATVQSNGSTVTTLEFGQIPMWSGDDVGFAVVAALSPEISITSPTESALITEQSILVAGEGKGWEGAINLSLFSNSDGVVLDRAYATGGIDEMAAFQAEMMVAGRDSGWIVARGDSGSDDYAPAFAANPIEWDAGQDPTEFTVSRLPVEDPDGGLNVRDLPGTDVGEVLATLPPGTSGIRRRGRVPANVGEEIWWDVITDDGLNGWVNASYLVRVETIDDGVLNSIGDSFLTGVLTGDNDRLAALPWSSTTPIQIGSFSALQEFSPELVATPAFWDSEVTWQLPADLDPATELSAVRDFLGLPANSTVLSTNSPDSIDNHSCGYCRLTVEWTFPGMTAITVGYGVDDFDIDDRVVTIYLEPTADGPEIIALAVWIWTP